MNKMISRNLPILWHGAAIVLLGLEGCRCDHELPCVKASIRISYVGYGLASLDTVIVRRFDKTTSGNKLKDSILMASPENIEYIFHSDTAMWAGAKLSGLSFFSLQSDWNYEVFILAAGRTYQITNIVEVQSTMDAPCFSPTMQKRVCMNSILSVNVDNKIASVDKSFAIYLSK